MPQYAARTLVPVDKSRVDIEKLVKRYGASGFASAWQNEITRIEFLVAGRHIRLTVATPSDTVGTRSRWRALLLLVKARLVAVDAKIVTFEQAFVGDIVMPDGRTVWETTRESIKLAYEKREPVALLGAAQ
jgi:hypothetical protein